MTKKLALKAVLIITLLATLSGCGFSSSGGGNSGNGASGPIIIGSKNFTESILLGDMMYDLLKANLKGVDVESKLNLGGTIVAWNALKSGQIDTYADYTGTGLVTILNQPVSNDADQTYQTVKTQYAQKYQIDWLDPLGFNNTYVLAVTPATAQKYHLKTISDLVAAAPNLTAGGDAEFFTRPDTYPGLAKAYGLHFKDTKTMDNGLKYEAAANNQIQVVDAFATDAGLAQFKLVTLQDDKHFFPPYFAAPIVREDTLKAHPEARAILNKLAGKIDDATMQKLNAEVDVQKMDDKEVAKQFLVQQGLLSA